MSQDDQNKGHEVMFVLIQYYTSLVLFMFQLAFFLPVMVLFAPTLDTPSTLLGHRVLVVYSCLPLLSLIGILFAFICILRRKYVVLSCLGLLLNCMYFNAFSWFLVSAPWFLEFLRCY